MNDPHVVALNYLIEHSRSIDYSDAEPLVVNDRKFQLTVENGRVRFELKQHFASVDDARKEIDDYIHRWEFDTSLKRGPNSFRLKFERPEVVDRNPIPGVVSLSATSSLGTLESSVQLVAVPPYYPSPPSDIALNPDIETMHHRYMGYKNGREPLASMAYFCLTVIESIGKSKNKRKDAAEYFDISPKVLNEIGYLSSTHGGPDARKHEGTECPLSPAQSDFLNAAVRAIIRRAAQKAHSPQKTLPMISWKNLPPLEGKDPPAAGDPEEDAGPASP